MLFHIPTSLRAGRCLEVMSMLKYIFAERLSSLCKERKVSVEKLAEVIGKSPRTINRYRNGQCENIPFPVLENICLYFHVEPSYLFTEEDET